ncbi:MAG: AgmX/PglI C-terminal domain-containing protein, partial [Deltaproteobacteria bacterium]|nr:AgmX/PglI C-terminal domain-containing protein [Deltaproteobacteria bacterium]
MNKKAFFVTVRNPGVPGAELVLDKSLGVAPEKLVVGSGPNCDLPARIPERHRLIKKALWGGYCLRIPAGAEGSITVKSTTLPIKGLLELGLLKKNGDSFLLSLPRDLSCTIDINGSTFVFEQREIPHAEKARSERAKMERSLRSPLLKREDSQFFVILAIIAVLNFIMIAYLSTVEIKKKDAREAIRAMPQRFARLILQPKAAPRKPTATQAARMAEPKEELKKGPKEYVKEEKPERKKEAKMEAARPKAEGGAAPAQQRTEGAQPARAVASRGLLAVITAKAKPISFDDNVFRELEKTADDVKRPDPRGAGVEGISSGNVLEKVEQVSREFAASAPASGSRGGSEILGEKKNTVIASLKKEKREVAAAVKRDEAGVYKTVMTYSGGLKYIYNNALRKTPTMRGKVTARITITPEGKVRKAEIINSTLNSPELEEQIAARIYLWKF